MNGDFVQAALMAWLREMLIRFPALTPAVLLAQLEAWGQQASKAFMEWNDEISNRFRLEYDESGTPTGYYFDSDGIRKHYTQG